MALITVDTPVSNAFGREEFAFYQKYLIYSPIPNPEFEESSGMKTGTLKDLKNVGWSPEGIAAGLNFLLKKVEQKKADLFFIYDDEACEADARKKDVNLLRLLPDVQNEQKTSIILCAGGAYESVCTAVEALPTARHFSEAGFPVWLFTYRVGFPGAAVSALDDLAAAIAYLTKDPALGFDPADYVIGGFSAGANLISNWGTGNNGWKRYGLPKPRLMLPIYTFIDLKQRTSGGDGAFELMMFGPDHHESIDVWNVAEHIDHDYPPCYIVCGKDDAVVPALNSEEMKALLDEANVSAVLDEGEHAPHGFGDGTGTDAEGWPERAAAFLESL